MSRGCPCTFDDWIERFRMRLDRPPLGESRVRVSETEIRVILVDDHHLVRAALRALLSQMQGLRVVADAKNGAELLKVVHQVESDVVILDVTMPDMDGIAALEELRKQRPSLRVLMLSMSDSADDVKRAVAKGANGYMRKDASQSELELALRSVMSTGSYFGSSIARRLLESTEPHPHELLTARQLEILTMLAQGRSTKEIGFQLGLSSKTIDVHRSRIMDRLGLRDVASLTLYAVRHRLLKP